MGRRVLHVSDNTTGGLGRFIGRAASSQRAGGDEVTLAAPAADELRAELSDAGARVLAWRAGPRPDRHLPRELRALARVVAETRPQIVHLHSDKAGFVGRLMLRRRRPTVYQPHAWSFFATTGLMRRASRTWERMGCRWTDVVVCVSHDERRFAERAGLVADFRVLPNGVDLVELAPASDAEREAARSRLGLGAAPLAVCVGRLHRQKNQHALLDIWPSVRMAVPEVTLALVGDGPDRPSLERRAVEGIHIVGQTDEVDQWLAAATLVVQPSVWEGMSFAVLEARARARSAVVTDVPGMREVVVPGTGAVVPPGDPATLRRAVVERLRDPELADGEGRAARAHVERHHDVRHQLRDISALYDELLSGETSPSVPARAAFYSEREGISSSRSR